MLLTKKRAALMVGSAALEVLMMASLVTGDQYFTVPGVSTGSQHQRHQANLVKRSRP